MGVYRRGAQWWISYTADGVQHREPAGANRRLAEQRLEHRRAEILLGEFSRRPKQLKLRDYAEEYLTWAKAKKASWARDAASLAHLTQHLGGIDLGQLRAARLEAYQQARLRERTRSGGPPTPATINREIACLKKLLSLARRDGLIAEHPARGVTMLPEHNVRDRIVSPGELESLLAAAPDWLKPVVIVANWTAMRAGEIATLTWDQLDLRAGFARLRADQTKTRSPRSVPLHAEVIEALRAIPRPIQGGPVFLCNGKPLRHGAISSAFARTRHVAGLYNVRFHDLRHTAINRWRLDGHDYFRIKKATGHKTMVAFERYNTVDEVELAALVGRGRYHNFITVASAPVAPNQKNI